MKTIKDTELNYVDGNRILEGDKVELEYSRKGGNLSEKIQCVIEYKNGSFYAVGKDFEITLSDILENNAQVPHKYPINLLKTNPLS